MRENLSLQYSNRVLDAITSQNLTFDITKRKCGKNMIVRDSISSFAKYMCEVRNSNVISQHLEIGSCNFMTVISMPS